VYVGQTKNGVDVRFGEHTKTVHADWKAKGYRTRRLTGPILWTPYEAAVWEQHFIDLYRAKGQLENAKDAINRQSYLKYRGDFNPCR
jgi:hypothetical protein